MNAFALLSADDRAAVFQETAVRKEIGNPSIIEKDFWITWILQQIFSNTSIPKPLFKGGTSLSKVYGVIHRFSEDIDLVLHRKAFGFADETDPANIKGTNARERAMDELCSHCIAVIRDLIFPALEGDIRSLLGKDGWKIEIDSSKKKTILFEYPRAITAERYSDYLRPIIRLEFGCRGDDWPAEQHEMTPYAAEYFPGAFAHPSCSVNVLSAERTFWEKITLMHGTCHNGKLQPRLSRHWYDVSSLAIHEIGEKALGNVKLLKDVVSHKNIFFRSMKDRNDLAMPGSLKLVPDGDLLKGLKIDYERMQEMIFKDAPTFDEMMRTIQTLQARINS